MNRIRLVISIVAFLVVLFAGIVSMTGRVQAGGGYCSCTTIWGTDGVKTGNICEASDCIIIMGE